MSLTKLYSVSPVYLQNFFISIYGYYWKNRRFGGDFKKEILEWKAREGYTKKEWEEYQTVELRKLLCHAFETVPFYNELYKKNGFKKENFLKFTINDIKKLPYLEKEDLRKFGTSTLLSTKKMKGCFYSSSGSTGTPTKIYFSKEFHRKWNAAYEARVRNWAGVDYQTPRGMIGGRRVLPEAKNEPPFYRYNSAEKQTYFSAYHISSDHAEDYLKGIVNHKVEYMVGYAMSNYFLADFIERKKLEAPTLKAVITSSEKLTSTMRETFKRVYGCKTYDGYSGMEACGLISENSNGDFLFSPDTGILELIDDNGNEVDFGCEGEIISTGLLNFDQPLIRYRIGDRAKKSLNQQSKSGIQMPMFDEISGRVEDVVTSSDGKKMVRFHGIFIDIKGLISAQLIQETIDHIKLNLIVNKSKFEKESEGVIIERLKSQLGNEIIIQFNYVDDIPKNNNGKFRAVISKV